MNYSKSFLLNKKWEKYSCFFVDTIIFSRFSKLFITSKGYVNSIHLPRLYHKKLFMNIKKSLYDILFFFKVVNDLKNVKTLLKRD